jgi:polysaccharide biosynthesis transport protein
LATFGVHHRRYFRRYWREGTVPEQLAAEPIRPLTVAGLVRRRFLAILIPTLLVPGAALALTLQQEKEYEASTSLLFRDSGFGSTALASADPDREAATNLRLLQLDTLKRRVNADRANPFPGDVDVVTEAEANLATITVTDTDPERAARMADAIAQEYIALREETAAREIKQERQAVHHQLSQIPLTTGPGGVGPPKRRGERAQALKQRLRELTIAEVAPVGVSQVERAEVPTSAVSPHPLRNTVIGAILGLVIGFAFAIWLERRDQRLRDAHDLEAAFGRPILGRIPQSRTLARSSPGTGALAPPEEEAFRTLRANLRHVLDEEGARSVLVTSANPGEGKTTVAWNLARAEAAFGAKVLMVEADMRRPVLARRLGASATPGLSQLLTAEGRLEDLIQSTGFQEAANGNAPAARLDVLLAGTPPSNPAELLGSDRMRAVLEAIPEAYDLVVLDTPPASVVSDVIPMLDSVGGVVVVGRLGMTTYESAVVLREQLENLDAPVLGVVVNSDLTNLAAVRYSYAAAGT